jgi:hypothetical protein
MWAVAGLVLGLIIRGLTDGGWVGAAAVGLPMGLLAGSISLSAWYVCRAMPVARTSGSRVVTTALLAAVVTAAIWAALGQMWWRVLDWIGGDFAVSQPPGLFPLLLVMGGLTYLLAVTVHYVWQAFEDSTAASRQALVSQVAQRDAELRALRSQIDPHFLFNSLNSIAGLIGSDPEKARRMCHLLGDFLRDSLSLGRASRISLGREVALAQQYLGVEQVRFGQRLQVHTEVAEDAADVPVPPLLLQPLVENAVRHGIVTRLEGGTITIQARRAGERAVVVVTNPRDTDRTSHGTGFGLDIVRRRLEASFADRAALVIDAGAEQYRVSMTIPVEVPA